MKKTVKKAMSFVSLAEALKVNNPYDRVTVTGCLSVCLSICLYRRISLTTEPIRFSYTGLQLLIGHGKVYDFTSAATLIHSSVSMSHCPLGI